MKYILIIIHFAFNGGSSMATAEFDSREACQEAGVSVSDIVESRRNEGSIFYRCMAKGLE